MATQIAATPVLKGDEARAVLEESKKKPTTASRRGIEFLKNKFQISRSDDRIVKVVMRSRFNEV